MSREFKATGGHRMIQFVFSFNLLRKLPWKRSARATIKAETTSGRWDEWKWRFVGIGIVVKQEIPFPKGEVEWKLSFVFSLSLLTHGKHNNQPASNERHLSQTSMLNYIFISNVKIHSTGFHHESEKKTETSSSLDTNHLKRSAQQWWEKRKKGISRKNFAWNHRPSFNVKALYS